MYLYQQGQQLPLNPRESEYIRFFGRTAEIDGDQYITWTCSGFEVAFEGTGFSAELFASVHDNADACPYIGVLVDGAEQPADMQTIAVNQPGYAFYCLAEGLDPGPHRLKVVKLSEAQMSYIRLRSIRPEGGRMLPCPAPDYTLKMEFIGDSITTGFGNLCPTKDGPFRTSEQDGWQSYAAIAARKLDAEAHLICISGYAVHKSPYGKAVPPLYPYVDGLQGCHIPWDFDRFQPDIVVINLGTNDGSWMVNEMSSHIPMQDKREQFIEAYRSFLHTVRGRNQQAKIICMIGMLNTVSIPDVEEAVRRAKADGLSEVYYLRLQEVPDYGAGHPGLRAHQVAAEALSTFINQIFL